MDDWIQENLCCPYCGGHFEWPEAHVSAHTGSYGILTCDCSQFPVVDGICVLKKAPVITEVTKLIEQRRFKDALMSLLALPNSANREDFDRRRYLASAINRLTRLADWNPAPPPIRSPAAAWADLLSAPDRATAHDLLRSYFHDKNENYHYFFYRFSQPRFLVAISFASIVTRPEGPLLDLACGCGSVTRTLIRYADGQRVIGVDRFFLGLYIAKRIVAPQATYVCCDIDTSLPFCDQAFEMAICSDAFHYFLNKKTCIRELGRIISDTGFFILCWVHSAAVRMANDGLPLPPEAYERLVSDLPHRLVADSKVLSRYLQRLGPPLGESADPASLLVEPLLSIVASHRKEIFKDYGHFPEWPHALGPLRLNPLYKISEPSQLGKASLKRTLPSLFYENDHAQSKEYLPDIVDVPMNVLEDLAAGERTPEVERLVEQFVALGLPDRYVREN